MLYDGAEEKEFWGKSLFRIEIPVPNVPQSTVLGHCLAAGLASGSQLVESQVTAPGVPDLPAATPHFVAQPLGSARRHVPKEWIVPTNQANKLEKEKKRAGHIIIDLELSISYQYGKY